MKRAMRLVTVMMFFLSGMHLRGWTFQDMRPCDVVPANINFGQVQIGFSRDSTFAVINNGPNPFTVEAISSNNPAFTVAATDRPLPATLGAGETLLVTVQFECVQEGVMSGQLTLDTAPDGVCGVVRVSGTCTVDPPPNCGVSRLNLAFGEVEIGEIATQPLVITNNGPDPFTVLFITSDNFNFGVFTTDPPLPATLNVGQSLTATVEFFCFDLGAQSGTLTFDTDPPEIGCGPVRVSATCGPGDQPPGDGGGPVPRDQTTEITDREGSGAAVIFPAFSLAESQTWVAIERLAELPKAPFPEVPGFRRVTEVVRYIASSQDRAFGPGMILRLPLLPEFAKAFPKGKKLRLFELGEVGQARAFLDTGIIAEVGGTRRRQFVFAPHVEVFRTYAAFEEVQMPAGVSGQAQAPRQSVCSGGWPLFIPLVEQIPETRFTRLSLINPSERPANIRFTAFNRTGQSITARSDPLTLGPLQQRTVAVADLFALPPGDPFWSIVGCSDNPSVTGMYEVTDTSHPTLQDATMWAAAPVQFTAESALIFPLLKRDEVGFRRIHLFNPSAEAVSFDLCLFNAQGQAGNPTSASLSLPAWGRLVIDQMTPPAQLNGLDLSRLTEGEDGYLFVRVTTGAGLVGAELFGPTGSNGAVRSVALLNGLPLPPGYVNGQRRRDGPLCPVVRSRGASPFGAAASLSRSLYATHFETGPGTETVRTEFLLINVTDGGVTVDASAFSPSGQETGRRQQLALLGAKRLFRAAIQDLPNLIPLPGGYVRFDVPDAGVVGLVINREVNGHFLSVVPLGFVGKQVKGALTPRAAAPEVFLSRIKQDRSTANPHDSLAFVMLYPNHDPARVPVMVELFSPTGGPPRSRDGRVEPQGTFGPTHDSLADAFRDLVQDGGFLRVTASGTEGFGREILAVGVYRRQHNRQLRFVSAVSAQVRPSL